MVSYLFPSDPFKERSWRVDEHFAFEHELAAKTHTVGFLDLYSLSDRVRLKLPEDFESPVVYRGWMLSEEEYSALEQKLATLGYTMLTSPSAYLETHRIESWIERFKDLTPATVVLESTVSESELLAAAATLPGEHGFFLKGSSKSDSEFSYAATFSELPALLAGFLESSSPAPDSKLALRSFVPLDKTVAELRTWWVGGKTAVIGAHPNFVKEELTVAFEDEQLLKSAESFLQRLEAPIGTLESSFLTADIALTTAGDWILVEIGDGQVSGAPQY